MKAHVSIPTRSDTVDPRAQEIIEFWQGLGEAAWFVRSDEVDDRIRERFAALHAEASSGALDGWMQDPDECLALIILLDQFSRNMFRGSARAFASDAQALAVANHALARGFHLRVDRALIDFVFMPLMHSESIIDQHRCVALMHAFSGPTAFEFAILHRRIIQRFGRYPHRNAVVGRATTPAEKAYLDNGGFSA
jgi:uncharacterized protein (DUF924 family)